MTRLKFSNLFTIYFYKNNEEFRIPLNFTTRSLLLTCRAHYLFTKSDPIYRNVRLIYVGTTRFFSKVKTFRGRKGLWKNIMTFGLFFKKKIQKLPIFLQNTWHFIWHLTEFSQGRQARPLAQAEKGDELSSSRGSRRAQERDSWVLTGFSNL